MSASLMGPHSNSSRAPKIVILSPSARQSDDIRGKMAGSHNGVLCVPAGLGASVMPAENAAAGL
eukprot:2938397-Prymnesium_polylepis.1